MGKKKDYVFRVTKHGDGRVTVAYGDKLSVSEVDNDIKLDYVGEALIKIGTMLMTSSLVEDDE